jgi:DNA polymerase sigma
VRATARTPIVNGVPGCRFETGMAFSRRRIPYSIGGELLDPVANVKATLDPEDEKKLTGDMRALYDRLLPSGDSESRRAQLVQKLERILNERWPGNDIKVHVFGSSGNLLCSNDSDGRRISTLRV